MVSKNIKTGTVQQLNKRRNYLMRNPYREIIPAVKEGRLITQKLDNNTRDCLFKFEDWSIKKIY